MPRQSGRTALKGEGAGTAAQNRHYSGSTQEDEPVTDVPWWRDAVCYQIYVRSFADCRR